MKAAIIRRYGDDDAVEIAEIDDPRPAEGEALIEVHAASVNPIDWKMRSGFLKQHFSIDFPRILGRDMAGVVLEAPDGAGLKAGDRIYAFGDAKKPGTFAERMAIDAALCRPMPSGLSFVEAASLPLAFLTAWISLVQVGDVKHGERILIHAGAGGVGSLAIQIAKHLGAWVATTCSGKNLDYVRELGADQAIDYRTTDFSERLRDLDLVYDTMGGDVYDRSFKTLRSGGRLVWIRAAPIRETPPRPDIDVKLAIVDPQPDLLDRLRELVESGALRPQVGTVMPLAEAREALRLSQAGHGRGKIVLKIA